MDPVKLNKRCKEINERKDWQWPDKGITWFLP